MQIVYGLEDQRDKLFHYIGITDDVYTRFIAHIRGSGGNIEKNGWIFECRKANSMIAMHELQRIELDSEDLELAKALEREKYWIQHYLDLGHPLNNVCIARSILKEQTRVEHRIMKIKAIPQKKDFPTMQFQSTSHVLARSLEEAFEAYQPGMSNRALAQVLNVSHPTAGKYIQRLKDKGMIG